MKQRFYRLNRILKTDPNYIILLGERSNGKSYSVKEHVIKDFLKNGNQFIYLRRYQLETKANAVEEYFEDMPIEQMTDGKYNSIICWRGSIYFAKRDEEELNKVEKGDRIGYVHYLSGAQHFKSRMFPKVYSIIYEEFVSKDMYIYDEPNELLDYVSTVLRRRDGLVFLIGNTISRVCPYFNEWELRNIPRMKQGQIDTYDMDTREVDENGNKITVRISVEYCENSGKGSTMFFGKSAENINGGAWKTELRPRLPKKLEEYYKVYELEIRHMGFSFIMQLLSDNENVLLYVYPNTKRRKLERVITHEFSENRLTTKHLLDNLRPEKIIRFLLNENKICFSDNLTGSDFIQILNEMGGI